MPGTTPYCETCHYHTINTTYPPKEEPRYICKETIGIVNGKFGDVLCVNVNPAHYCPHEFSCDKHVPKSKL